MSYSGINNQNQHTSYGSAEQAKKDLEKMITRLEDELEKVINMFSFARESLQNEMVSGMGYKQQGLPEAFTKKLKELTIGLNSVVESKIKYDKHKKLLAKTMSPEEERDAVVAYIMSLTDEERHRLRDKLNDRGVFKWKS